MGQLNCPVSGIGGYLRAPCSLRAICGPPQFAAYLRAPTVLWAIVSTRSLRAPAICGLKVMSVLRANNSWETGFDTENSIKGEAHSQLGMIMMVIVMSGCVR